MTKEQKLEAIYEAMADKTLSQGCKVWYGSEHTVGDLILTIDDELAEPQIIESIIESDGYTIIGHPVRIGDLLDYWDFEGTEYSLLEKWKNKRLPIDDQSDECIDFVYSLIKK